MGLNLDCGLNLDSNYFLIQVEGLLALVVAMVWAVNFLEGYLFFNRTREKRRKSSWMDGLWIFSKVIYILTGPRMKSSWLLIYRPTLIERGGLLVVVTTNKKLSSFSSQTGLHYFKFSPSWSTNESPFQINRHGQWEKAKWTTKLHNQGRSNLLRYIVAGANPEIINISRYFTHDDISHRYTTTNRQS